MSYLLELGILQHALLWTVVFLCFAVYYSLRKGGKLNLPPGPKGLPLVGFLPFLGKNPHLELCKLGEKYGGIFSIYLGRSYVVVVTDVAVAKQLLAKTAAADRPPEMFHIIESGAGFADKNGLEWIEQRRYTMMEMKNLGLGKSHWENLVQMEVSDMLELIAQSQGKPLDVKGVLSASISNNIMSFLTNERLPVEHPSRDIIDRGVESFQMLNNQSSLVTYYPNLFKLAVSLGLMNVGDKMKDIMDMHKYVRQEIEKSKKDHEGQTFIKKYLTEIEKNQNLGLGNSFNERNLIGNVQALIIAGSDTTYVSLYWLLLAMASFPKIQEKVHQELDNVLGKDGSVDFADRLKLPYCMAAIMEGQRWRTVAILNLLHRTNEDISISGYDIPEGTNIMTVIWAFHNDTKYWDDPDAFQPERFLTNNGQAIKEQEAYFAFSFGKRVCPGKTVAYIELFHYFVGILQKFHVLPESESKLPDLEGFPGLTLQPKRQPLRFIPR